MGLWLHYYGFMRFQQTNRFYHDHRTGNNRDPVCGCPVRFKGTGNVDARFAVMFGFLLFGAILPAQLSRRNSLLLGFAIMTLFALRTAQTAAIWDAHNRDLGQLRGAMSLVESGSRVLLAAVSMDEASHAQRDMLRRQYLSDGSRLDAHTLALLLIERHAFWPFLFANPEQHPVKLRPPFSEVAERTVGIPDLKLLSAPVPDPRNVANFPLEDRCHAATIMCCSWRREASLPSIIAI